MNKIIAVDFDGTLCAKKWPEIGEPNIEVISYIKKEKANGSKIILWTCRTGELLANAIRWCDVHHQLQFDMVNANLPEVIKDFGDDTRKIFANEYIDDSCCSRFQLPFDPLLNDKYVHPYINESQCNFKDKDIQNIEAFLSKVEPVIDFLEMQSMVRMQYDVYKRMMRPGTILNAYDAGGGSNND